MKTAPITTAPATDSPELQALDRSTRNMGYWFLAYLLIYPLPWLRRPPELLDVLAAVIGIALFLPLYLAGFGRSDKRALHCGAAVAAIGLLLQPFGGLWGMFIVYACGLLGGVRPQRRAYFALAAVALAVAGLVLLQRVGLWDWLPTLFFGTMTAMVSMYSAAYATQSTELAASRDRERRLAVVAERERIARDLHDLLGHTLTVVAVKADLAGRLIDADPARAKAEIEDIHRTARAALADVRAAVTGMRSTRLATELATARSALSSAGIILTTQGVPPALPPAVETALAFVLMEGVTNVVRHAQARQCEVAFAQEDGDVVLSISDSGQEGGVLAAPHRQALADLTAMPALPAEGHGVAGMRQRLTALGGTLTLQPGPAGTTLVARVPLSMGVSADVSAGSGAGAAP